jgi:hypothetical protein
MSSFHVDGRVCVRMELDLAVRLGEFLVEADTVDKQLKAMGHRLVELDGDYAPGGFADRPSVPTYAPAGKAYVTGHSRPVPAGQPVFQPRARRQIS